MSESEIVKDFLVEAMKISTAGRELVAGEKPEGHRRASRVFRTSIPSRARVDFSLRQTGKSRPLGESLLTLLRDGELTLNPDRTTALLGMVDAVPRCSKRLNPRDRWRDDYPDYGKC